MAHMLGRGPIVLPKFYSRSLSISLFQVGLAALVIHDKSAARRQCSSIVVEADGHEVISRSSGMILTNPMFGLLNKTVARHRDRDNPSGGKASIPVVGFQRTSRRLLGCC